MSAAVPVTFAGCLLTHLFLASLVTSPWWVPDLTLVGLVVTVARAPHRWAVLSGLAGLFMAVWAIRFAQQIFLGYLVTGWAVHALCRQWDLTDRRVQWLVVGIASLAMTFGALWLDGLWSPALMGLAMTRVALTCLSAGLIWRSTARLPA